MTPKEMQAKLNDFTLPKALEVDGIIGGHTMKAIDAVLASVNKVGTTVTVPPTYVNWSDSRKQLAFEQLVYKMEGIEVGAIDGLIGEQTRYARTVWEARKAKDPKKAEAVEDFRDKDVTPATPPKIEPKPAATKWPLQSEAAMSAFFGAKGTNQVKLDMPFPLRIAWDVEKQVRSYSCNQRVLVPMKRIWQRTLEHYGYEKIKQLRLDMFGGCLNVRQMRGGSAWSIHSWGCAYDVDPDRNQLKFKRASASLDGPEYIKFWEFVYDEGAISLGIERDYDWMHFQFARLK